VRRTPDMRNAPRHGANGSAQIQRRGVREQLVPGMIVYERLELFATNRDWHECSALLTRSSAWLPRRAADASIVYWCGRRAKEPDIDGPVRSPPRSSSRARQIAANHASATAVSVSSLTESPSGTPLAAPNV
jgi:hypothetical protein